MPSESFALAKKTAGSCALACLNVCRTFHQNRRNDGAAIDSPRMLRFTEPSLISSSRLRPGESIVFAAGQPPGVPGTANLIKLHRLSPRPLAAVDAAA